MPRNPKAHVLAHPFEAPWRGGRWAFEDTGGHGKAAGQPTVVSRGKNACALPATDNRSSFGGHRGLLPEADLIPPVLPQQSGSPSVTPSKTLISYLWPLMSRKMGSSMPVSGLAGFLLPAFPGRLSSSTETRPGAWGMSRFFVVRRVDSRKSNAPRDWEPREGVREAGGAGEGWATLGLQPNPKLLPGGEVARGGGTLLPPLLSRGETPSAPSLTGRADPRDMG